MRLKKSGDNEEWATNQKSQKSSWLLALWDGGESLAYYVWALNFMEIKGEVVSEKPDALW
jgi:hypothetical protein